MSANTQTWKGANGAAYTYYVHPIGTDLKAEGGNYIFAFLTAQSAWRPVYIGETGDLSTRFDDHHKMPCIKKAGATHIHAHLNAKLADRLAEEDNLTKNYGPSCNG